MKGRREVTEEKSRKDGKGGRKMKRRRKVEESIGRKVKGKKKGKDGGE